MDLEEELDLAQDFELEVERPQQDEPQNDLGIDDDIKLSNKQRKRAKIDHERLLNRSNGLKFIVQKHQGVSRIVKKHDKALAKQLESKSLSSSRRKQLKLENEYNNLELILQFYQMWCHGLFPKANFKDCIQLLRSYGATGGPLKIYRHGLLEKAVNDYKRANGIIVENDVTAVPSTSDIFVNEDEPRPESNDWEKEDLYSADVDVDDDWSFMNINKNTTNGLFVGDDDDEEQDKPDQSENRQTSVPAAPAAPEASKPEEQDSDNDSDPFSDDFDYSTLKNTYPEEEVNEYPDEDIENEAELEVMREMGM